MKPSTTDLQQVAAFLDPSGVGELPDADTCQRVGKFLKQLLAGHAVRDCSVNGFTNIPQVARKCAKPSACAWPACACEPDGALPGARAPQHCATCDTTYPAGTADGRCDECAAPLAKADGPPGVDLPDSAGLYHGLAHEPGEAKPCTRSRSRDGVATGQPAHSKSEYKRRVAMGDPNVTPPVGVDLPDGGQHGR